MRRFGLRTFVIVIPLLVGLGGAVFVTLRDNSIKTELEANGVTLYPPGASLRRITRAEFPRSGAPNVHPNYSRVLPLLTQLPNLSGLQFAGTLDYGDLERLNENRRIKTLDLTRCVVNLARNDCAPISFPQLLELRLGWAGDTDVLAGLVAASPRLRSVRVSQRPEVVLSRLLQAQPELLSRLEVIEISGDYVNVPTLRLLSRFENLQELRIGYETDDPELPPWQLRAPLSKLFRDFRGEEELAEFPNNAFAQMQSLKERAIEAEHLTEPALIEFFRTTKSRHSLEVIDLHWRQDVTSAVLQEIQHFDALRHLDTSDTPVANHKGGE